VANTAIIVAGGKSSRMRSNKALLKIDHRSMIQVIYDELTKFFPNLIIVANEPHLYSEFNAQIVQDIYPGHGPLSGIHAGLTNSETDKNFFIACDMPFVNGHLAEYLCNQEGEWDAVVPQKDSYFQPLYAVYKKSCLPSIERCILENRHKITSFYNDVYVKYINHEVIGDFGNLERIFSNINTPEEFTKGITDFQKE
jgi:molybdenum cofactor guanylyltransferase